MSMVAHGAGETERRSFSSGGPIVFAIGTALAGEACLVLAARIGANFPALLLMHAVITALMAAILFSAKRQSSHSSIAIVALATVAVAGPAGAVAAVLAWPFLGTGEGDAKAIDDWYERLAAAGRAGPPEELNARLVSGRVQDLDAPAPENFERIIEEGTLEQKQRALGLMARRFHPEYTPVLQAALRSREPVVRVQASAVVARVRDDLKLRIATLAEANAPESLRQSLSRVSEFETLQDCGFVEKAQRAVCLSLKNELLSRLLEQSPDVVPAVMAADRPARLAIESFLLNARRFKDLRAVRRVCSMKHAPGRRLRRLNAKRA